MLELDPYNLGFALGNKAAEVVNFNEFVFSEANLNSLINSLDLNNFLVAISVVYPKSR